MSRMLSTTGRSQADERRGQNLWDQHGRMMHASIEKKSGYPVGPIQLLMDAPLEPDQKYLILDPLNVTKVTIDYASWIRDRQIANAEYHARAIEVNTANNWAPLVAGEPYPKHLTKEIGKPPLPVEPIVAAAQGNKWVLGLTNVIDTRLAHFFEKPIDAAFDLSAFPDYSTDEQAEEDFDAEALGGQNIPVRATNKPRSHHRAKPPVAGASGGVNVGVI